MQAITTRYLPPTNTLGARVRAKAANGASLSLPYCHEAGEGSHARVALALAQKLGWMGTLIEGSTRDGRVFVFASGEKHTIEAPR